MPYRKFAKDIALIGSTNLAMAFRGIIILPVITKILGVQDYGIWAQLTTIIYLLTPLAGLGLPYALVRFLAFKEPWAFFHIKSRSSVLDIEVLISFLTIKSSS